MPMKNKFTFTDNVMNQRAKIDSTIEEYELKYLPCATVDSKDGVVLELNCFPAAAEIYKEGFVKKTVEVAIKMANVSKRPLKVILLTEDFTRHDAYLKNINHWFRDISSMDGVNEVARRTFEEFNESESADIIISNSDLRFESTAKKITWLGIPCFPHPYAGWWRRSKIGASRQIDELCLSIGINPYWIQPDYRYVDYEKFNPAVLEKLKQKTLEMIQLYPEGVFVKHAAGTQGYGGMHISRSEEYDKKDVRETLSFKRGFRGSKIHGLLIQRCMSHLKYPFQLQDNDLRLITQEERAAELYFIMLADNNMRASIHDIFIRIGPGGRCYNINKQGELFKNFSSYDFNNLGITPDDLEAASLAARLAYVAVDEQIKRLVENPLLEEKVLYNL